MKLIDPLDYEDFFKVKELVKLQDLFEARVHLGHKEGNRNPFMAPYLFGNRLGSDIIDLEQTVPLFKEALNFAAHIAFRNGVILFISHHLQTLPMVEKLALECEEYAHCRGWRGGTLTNSIVRFGSIVRLPDLVIFLSTHDNVFEEHEAVVESAKMNIPTIAIVDSSCDPRLVTYPIPGNDDSPASIQLYCKLFKQAIMAGKKKRKEALGENE